MTEKGKPRGSCGGGAGEDAAMAGGDGDSNTNPSGERQVDIEFDAGFERTKLLLATHGEAAIKSSEEFRPRAFIAILYPESMNPDAWGILTSGNYRGCVSPLHDRDRKVNADGTIGDFKKPHYHLLLHYPGKKSLESVREFVEGTLYGTMVQPCQSIPASVRYWAHMDIQPDVWEDDRGKVHYSPDEIKAFGGFDYKRYMRMTEEAIEAAAFAIADVIDGEHIIRYHDLVRTLRDNHPDLCEFLLNPTTARFVSSYTASVYHASREKSEVVRLRKANEEGAAEVNALMRTCEKMCEIMKEAVTEFTATE